MEDNLKLWKVVEKTNPAYTKKANVKGNNITSISPQYQILNATKQFGPYGVEWGFKDMNIDYTLMDKGLVSFKATFYFPRGEFETINSIQLYRDNAMTKIDDNFAKKLETDTLTKALSKLGFNADIFLGKFDDIRYIEEIKKEFQEVKKNPKLTKEEFEKLKIPDNYKHIETYLKVRDVTPEQREGLIKLKELL